MVPAGRLQLEIEDTGVNRTKSARGTLSFEHGDRFETNAVDLSGVRYKGVKC